MDRRTALAFLIIGILTVAYFMSMSRAPQPRAEPAAQPPAAETAKPAPEAPAETNPATVPPTRAARHRADLAGTDPE